MCDEISRDDLRNILQGLTPDDYETEWFKIEGVTSADEIRTLIRELTDKPIGFKWDVDNGAFAFFIDTTELVCF